MLNKSYIKLIERLTSAPGAPGFEEEVTKIAATYVKENGFAETRENSIRNLYLTRHGNTGKKPMLMLDAHGDEVGFMVKSIRPDGTLQVLELGGISRQKIQGSRVKVRMASGEYIPGVIASIPPHFISESANTEIVIDIGARSKEDAIQNFGV
ncbi:MAG: M42 family peptidase, partial [Lentisphaerae bacterium]|nr:M42 family peptidase [Lentisphaerota bacterium]